MLAKYFNLQNSKVIRNGYLPIESRIKRLANGLIYVISDLDADCDGTPNARRIDPCGQPGTSLRINGHSVDALTIPYFVLPINWSQITGENTQLGDYALLRYRDKCCFAIFADRGPSTKIGEASVCALEALGYNPWNQDRTKIISGIDFGVEYIIFPRTLTSIPNSFRDIQLAGQAELDKLFAEERIVDGLFDQYKDSIMGIRDYAETIKQQKLDFALKITHDTWLKTSPFPASTLVPEQKWAASDRDKYEVTAIHPDEDGHYCVELTILPGRIIYCYSGHAGLYKGENPDEVGAIIPNKIDKLKYPFLIFSMPLDNTSELNKGRLCLRDYDKGDLGRWVATSGLGMYQQIGGWSKQGGGVCPAAYQCDPPFANYWVDVNPTDLSSTKGVEGNGYPITPFEVTTKDGVKRSDLLIHKDANVPGSMGCIVLPPSEFKDFEIQFPKLCNGHTKVKLWIQYDY